MASVLVATPTGCVRFTEDGKLNFELSGHRVGALLAEATGTCLGIVDRQEVWERNVEGVWSRIATATVPIQAMCRAKKAIYVGGEDQAILLRITSAGEVERVNSFDEVPGRSEWFAGGPPLGVRSLTASMDGDVLLAAVHVGGIPRSSDGGASWMSTVPVMFDIHEVRIHAQLTQLAAAAAAVGLCVSTDAGVTWKIFSQGVSGKTCLAVGVLEKEVLFSVQDGPFATRSQIWRWRIGSDEIEQVREGLPLWLQGKVDTGWIACSETRAAIVDGKGNLWLSETGSIRWKRIAAAVESAESISILA